MDHYRKTRRWLTFMIGLTIVFLSLNILFSMWQVFRVGVLTIQSENLVTQTRQGPIPDPCESLRNSDVENMKLLAGMRQKYALLMSKLALEVELSLKREGNVPAAKIADLLVKYDITENKIYTQLYGYSQKPK